MPFRAPTPHRHIRWVHRPTLSSDLSRSRCDCCECLNANGDAPWEFPSEFVEANTQKESCEFSAANEFASDCEWFCERNSLNFALAAEIPCECTFATKFASDCECDGVVHSAPNLVPTSGSRCGWWSWWMVPLPPHDAEATTRLRPIPMALARGVLPIPETPTSNRPVSDNLGMTGLRTCVRTQFLMS